MCDIEKWLFNNLSKITSGVGIVSPVRRFFLNPNIRGHDCLPFTLNKTKWRTGGTCCRDRHTNGSSGIDASVRPQMLILQDHSFMNFLFSMAEADFAGFFFHYQAILSLDSVYLAAFVDHSSLL